MRRAAFAMLPLAAVAALLVARPTANDDGEVARIDHHLRGVAAQLRAAPTDHLSPAQRAARTASIEWLEDYRRTGVFPHNHVHPEGPTPVFVDEHGTPCAVGYLLLRSGETGLVGEIVASNNLVRVRELDGDLRFERWLDERGLTLEEAARIQPAYQPRVPDPAPAPAPSYPEASIAFAVATATSLVFTEMRDPRPEAFGWPGWLSAAAFLGHGSLLALTSAESGDAPGWQTGVNVGGMLLAGIVTGRRLRRGAAAAPTADDQAIRWEPTLGVRGGATTLGVRITH